MRAPLLALLLIPAIGLAQDDAGALSRRRLSLVALGVPVDDAALALGERAERRCAAGERAACALAEAAYALASARAEHAELLSAFAALGRTPPPAPAEASTGGDQLARLRRDRARLEARCATLRRALAAVAEPSDAEAARALAVEVARAEAERAARDDDAYRARRSSGNEREAMRRQAIAALERSMPGRIARLRDPLLAERARAALAGARRIDATDARLDALLEVDAMLLAADRAPR